MGNNLKISDLPVASRIDDEALVVLVQDHSNKVVTVGELSDKINERQNHTIDHLWHEMKRLTNTDTVKALTNSLANHEYRIDGIEKLNGKQDGQLTNLTKAFQDMSAKQYKHEGDIRILRNANVENRRSLAYLNCRVDAQIEKSNAYFDQIDKLSYDLNEAVQKHAYDLAYTYDYIERSRQSAVDSAYAYTSYEVDNNWTYTYSSYTYIKDTMSTYMHFSCNEYWGGVKTISEIYGPSSFEENFVGEIKKDDTGKTGKYDNCNKDCGC